MLLAIILVGVASIAQGVEVRNYTSSITVTNGGQWGYWADAEFCPTNQYAIGYDMKRESYQFTGDDTALNSIALICSEPAGENLGKTVTSGQGGWGEWKGRVTCNQYPGAPMFLVSFSLEAEKPQGSLDDVAASWVKFQCRDFDATGALEVLNKDPGSGNMGSFGDWSRSCETGTAICGLSTKIEGNQGDGDDTSLNDVQFFCCPKPAHGPVVG